MRDHGIGEMRGGISWTRGGIGGMRGGIVDWDKRWDEKVG